MDWPRRWSRWQTTPRIPVSLNAPDTRLAPDVEATAYFVVAEALTNVAKYAQATQAG